MSDPFEKLQEEVQQLRVRLAHEEGVRKTTVRAVTFFALIVAGVLGVNQIHFIPQKIDDVMDAAGRNQLRAALDAARRDSLGISKILESLNSQGIDGIGEKLARADLPVGTIVAWNSNQNPPEGWVLCDGENGTPDLNGRFLRGASTRGEVGEVGGTALHDHAVTIAIKTSDKEVQPSGTGGPNVPLSTQKGKADGAPHLPPFYNVQFIMKKE